ncbi:hypothetical protein GUJ93_ZPchr0006g44419 [Zizania palustris]|uniref:Uncharacterized protein n=1 Tax=Zizania palustris TaxID=103762 RepID=A0A8J5SYL5_ZIZPA|nr:hypothetical protein GUJ93_ZPchr0006g44419 [Zizania palustris]
MPRRARAGLPRHDCAYPTPPHLPRPVRCDPSPPASARRLRLRACAPRPTPSPGSVDLWVKSEGQKPVTSNHLDQ